MSMRSTSFISPRHSVCTLPLRSILCTSCCVSFFVVAITPNTRRGPAIITGPLVCKKSKGGLYKMPVLRKRNLGMGWLWSACAGLEPASPHYAMRCVTSYTIGTISRDCGLSVVTLWRVDSTLSTFTSLCLYTTILLGRKTCKVSKEKAAIAGRRFRSDYSSSPAGSTIHSSASTSRIPLRVIAMTGSLSTTI